jgi:hypothetical protein
MSRIVKELTVVLAILAAAVVVMLAIAALAPTPVYGKTITLSNGGACSYGSITFDGNGDARVTCAAVVTPTPNPTPNPGPLPPPVVTPAPGAPPGCSTAATYLGTFTHNAQKIEYTLHPGQSAAVAFVPKVGTLMDVSTTETTGTPPEADHEVAVSRCPGDFTPSPPCRFQANFNGGTMFLRDGAIPFWKCQVTAGVTHYMNVRQIVRGSSSIPSCPSGAGCPIRVQVQNY